MKKIIGLIFGICSGLFANSVIVGPGRSWTTIQSAINSNLPLREDLLIYVVSPTLTYNTLQNIVPDANWNGHTVKVEGLKAAPQIVGYGEEGTVFEFNGDKLGVAYEQVAGVSGVEGRFRGEIFFAHIKDRLGSTRVVVKEDGQIDEAQMYYSYGNIKSLVASNNNAREKFTGKEYDTEGASGAEPGINLDYFGARYYDPDIGLWISPDAYRQFDSPYSYAGNGSNPINGVDGDGNFLDSFDENGNWEGELDPSSVKWGDAIDNDVYQGMAELGEIDFNNGMSLAGITFLPGKNPFIASGIGALGLLDNIGGVPKPSLSAVKKALRDIHKIVGSLPRWQPGKWGSPQRGGSKVGYRFDPAHPNAKEGSPETGWHINYWDWTKGKTGKGGIEGAIKIDGGP